MKPTHLKWAALLLAGSTSIIACDDDDETGDGTGPTQNIVEIAQGNSELGTLVQLVVAAGLDDDLSASGDLTVLAPSDGAFSALEAAQPGITNYLTTTQEGQQDLVDILQYHVLTAQSFSAEELRSGTADRTTLEGTTVQSAPSGDAGVAFTDATGGTASVTTANVEATNGIVHIIDSVLLPRQITVPDGMMNIVQVAQATNEVSTLVSLLPQSIIDALSAQDANVTVLAPTNDAFADLETAVPGVTDFLTMNPDGQALLADILQYHVLDEVLDAAALRSGTQDRATLLSGVTVQSAPDGTDGVVFTDAIGGTSNVVNADVDASNGIIHLIDSVLLPQEVSLPEMRNLVQRAQAEGDVSTLVSLLPQDIITALSDENASVTVLAPTNQAFTDLEMAVPGVTDFLTMTPEGQVLLAQILEYHVLDEELDAAALRAGTQDRDTLLTGVTVQSAPDNADGVVFTDATGGSSNVVTPNLEASNGIIHTIDRVLLPQQVELPGDLENIVATAQSLTDAGDAAFGTLLTVATALNLADTLSMGDDLTLFAPTDAAFTALENAIPGVTNYLTTDATGLQVLRNIVLSHVVQGEAGQPSEGGLTAMELGAEGAFFTLGNLSYTFAGTEISHPANAASTFTVDSNLLDVEATNGIIHGLTQVIVPPGIVDLVVADPNFTTLLDLVTNQASMGILQALSPDTLGVNGNPASPITVFAPTDAAFAAAGLGSPGQRRVDQVLSYHVVPGIVAAADLNPGDTLTTLTGAELTVVQDGGDLFLETETQTGENDRIAISQPDIRTVDGIIHVVDGVLIPEEPTLAEAADTANLNALLGAATSFGLDTVLADVNQDLTVFGPTDAAFGAALTPTQLTDLTNNGILENILLYHVVAGEEDSTAVLNATSLSTLANQDLPVDGTAATVDGVSLTDPGAELDFQAINGVLHVIPGVLLPPTILDTAQATPDLSELAAAVAGSQTLVDALSPDVLNGDAPVTVFAPVNAAFPDTLPPNAEQVVQYHVVSGNFPASSFMPMSSTPVTTVEGTQLTIVVDAQGNISLETPTQTGANAVPVTIPDVRALNGTVHIIDGVLNPAAN